MKRRGVERHLAAQGCRLGREVSLTEPEIGGSYVVAEQRDDGTLVLRPSRRDPIRRSGPTGSSSATREALDHVAEH